MKNERRRVKVARCRDIERKVLRSEMQKGIEKCKDNIADYLHDARLIAKAGRLYHAILSLEFALEEFGKILLLKETMNNDKNDPVEINGNRFCDHNRKAEDALTFLDPAKKFQVLFDTIFTRGIFKPHVWGETVVGNKTRLDCAFVDFMNNDWVLGRKINPDYFEELVKLVEDGLRSV